MKTKYYILFFAILSCILGISQPKTISNVNYFNQFIRYNDNRVKVYENIRKLHLKLGDTLYLESKSKDTTWLKKHREALYLNFLCYEYESRLTGNNSCKRQLGFDIYSRFYTFKDLKGFPRSNEYENEYEQARYLQQSFCIKIYIQNNSQIEQMPDSACGCKQAIKKLKDEQDERLLAAEKSKKESIKSKLILRQKEVADSISWLKSQIKYEPIYISTGVLRSDTSYNIKSKNIDSLNNFLVQEMIRASNKVFSFYVNNNASENIEKTLDVLAMQKNKSIYWNIKLKKVKGAFVLIDNIPISNISSSMCLKLISELYLNKISPYVEENQTLVLPFMIFRNSTYTDNRTILHRIENGYINIVLPIIIIDPKETTPYISPEEIKINEENRKQGIKYEE